MKLVGDDGAEIRLKHVSVVGLLPTDVVVVKVAQAVDLEECERISNAMGRFFPDTLVMILPEKLEIEIVRNQP